MPGTLGIELTPSRCSLVLVHPAGAGTRITAFDTIASGSSQPAALRTALKEIIASGRFPKHARVVVHGLRSTHRVWPMPPGIADEMAYARDIAAKEDAGFRAWAHRASVGLAVTSVNDTPGTIPRREALFAAIAQRDMRKRLRPLIDAGFVIDSLATPVLGLGSLGKVLRADPPDAVTAYLAMNQTGGSVAIVRGTRLLAGRDLTWTYGPEPAPTEDRLLGRYRFASALGPQLGELFQSVRNTFGYRVDQVMTCGDLPELRSLTMPLIQELDLEVETLDSPRGLDVASLPEPRAQFREQVARLQVAWAIAAVTPAVNLWAARRPVPMGRGTIVAMASGVLAASLLIAFGVFWPNGTARASRMARLSVDRSPATRVEQRSNADTSRAQEHAELLQPANPSASGDTTDDRVRSRPTSATAPSAELPQPEDPVPGPELVAAPLWRGQTSGIGDRGSVGGTVGTASKARRAASAVGGPRRNRAVDTPISRQELPGEEAAPLQTPRRAEMPRAREPVVRSILFSQDRRLAVVDNQIVGIGDSVGTAVVVDITRDAVLLRGPSGGVRRVAMKTTLGAFK
ncbi:MAG: hypothetical protein HYX76_09815 [Acidobacteria bacterium]|nr:hypothetical protein [Acidobacteriota bacterium]